MAKFSSIKGLFSVSYGETIGLAFSTIFWLWLAREIKPEEFGEIQFFLSIVTLVGYIVVLGTTETITVYTAKKIPLLSTFSFISLIGGGIGAIVLFIIFERIDVGVLLLGYIISYLAIGELLGNQKYSFYSKLMLIQKILTLGLGVGFFLVMGIDGIIFALGLTFLPFITRIIYGFKTTKIDFSLLKNNLKFTFTNYSIKLIGGFNGRIDALIIAPILGLAIFGNYTLGLVIINVMMMMPNLVFKYLLPKESLGENNNQIKKYTIILSVIIAILSALLFPHILPLIFPQFTEVINIIQIMSFAIIPKLVVNILEAKFLGLEKSRILLTGFLIQLITTLVTMIYLGLTYGIVGVAVAFVLSISSRTIYYIIQNYMLNKRENINKNE